MREENEEGHYFSEITDDLEFSELKFELIEDETIDIDNIEEIIMRPYMGLTVMCEDIEKNFNEILRAVKQLNKEIKSIKEKNI